MSNLATVRQGVTTAFDAAGDLAVLNVTLHRKTRNEFDDNVLRPVAEYADTVLPKVLVLDFTAEELENRGIRPTDQKVLINGANLSIVPIPEDDRITIGGKLWQIKKVKVAPMGVLITIQVRSLE